jgi:hypothetical protein
MGGHPILAKAGQANVLSDFWGEIVYVGGVGETTLLNT